MRPGYTVGLAEEEWLPASCNGHVAVYRRLPRPVRAYAGRHRAAPEAVPND